MSRADGSKSGAEFLVNTTTPNDQSLPTITELTDGRIVVSWTDASQTAPDTNGLAVRAQIFDVHQPVVSDFNGDGHSDILWQNTDGTPAVWLMDGFNVVAGSNVAFNPGASWHEIPAHHDVLV